MACLITNIIIFTNTRLSVSELIFTMAMLDGVYFLRCLGSLVKRASVSQGRYRVINGHCPGT